jgi:hypothetical protein
MAVSCLLINLTIKMKIGLLYNLNQQNSWYEADFDTPETIVALKDSLDNI